MSGKREQGGARLGAVIWILLFVVFVIIAKEAIPVKIKSSKLEDFMIELAKFSARMSEENLQRRILEKADELGLPVVKDHVSVKNHSGRIRMHVTYQITLDFPFYDYVWHFDHNIDRPVFII